MNIKFLLLALLPISAIAQNNYPTNVQAAINQTNNNKTELTKALDYCYATKDADKIKSINFLVANMPIHKSYNYYWADSLGKRIAYNEMDYPSFKEAVAAVEQLKTGHGKLHPVSYSYRDIDSIKATMLIANVELAVEKLHARNGICDEHFLEYILPYRTSVEPLQDWRKIYSDRFANVLKPTSAVDLQMMAIGRDIKKWFTNTYKIENRGEPLPRLGALQLLSRANGACEDIAGLAAFMARSQGYGAAVDFVPAWATASGVHFVNYINIPRSTKHHYDAADGYVLDTLAREPAKVLRTTYSSQNQTLAALLNDTSEIPNNFMRLQNYKDVTQEYWQTADVHARLFPLKSVVAKAAFVSVWNFSRWDPVWYSMLNGSNGSTTFTNMCKGAVYLPMYYIERKLVPAGWPIINGYGYTTVLQPDTMHKRTVHIKEQPLYLAFRPGKKYLLLYWDNRWVRAGIKIPDDNSKELVFDNVPSNALLLLLPEYTQKKERPFVITEKGERLWF